ncbi:hypothetical protein [Mesorhizobium amorphae]|uniref:hypothetical protein n=1 Tax=Mesorhizobium amorphae TaxID=71433 RepID=UPI00177F17DE|nr:hypothetical protein [Mesorhizobium amorphae]
MTFVQNRPSADDVASRAANDNHAAPEDFSVLDLIPSEDDDKVDETVRRTERLAIALVIGMAIWLIVAPMVYVTLRHAI